MRRFGLVISLLVFVFLFSTQVRADSSPRSITQMCPTTAIQQQPANYQPSGIILTAFDKTSIWVYNISQARRYPLPDTAPCSRNCHLSPDAEWLTYFNDPTNTINIMHLDGTQRSLVAENAGEVEWWNSTTYLVWTPGKGAYLIPIAGGDREYLDTENITSIEPGGRYGVMIEPKDDGFERFLVNLQLRDLENVSDGRIDLGPDQAYFNAQSWSPDGSTLAFVGPVSTGQNQIGAEIYTIKPGDSVPKQITHLTSSYGAERINGVAVGELSWSPDGKKIAFWVTPMKGTDPTDDKSLGHSTIHVLNVGTGALTEYCGYETDDQTPNPPSLMWSPDSTHLAFAGALPKDESGYYLLAMDTSNGQITSLSQGVYPALGSPDVIAWGNTP